MNTKVLKFCIAIAILGSVSSASATAHNPKNKKTTPDSFVDDNSSIEVAPFNFNNPSYVQANKYWSKEGRRPASDQDALAKEFDEGSRKLLDAWVKLTPIDSKNLEKWKNKSDNEKIELFFEENEARYASMTPNEKYIYNYIRILRPFNAIVWKVRPIFEIKKEGGSKPAHVAAVMLIRNLTNGIHGLDPSGYWDRGAKYLTEPTSRYSLFLPPTHVTDGNRNDFRFYQLHSMSQLQWYVKQVVIPQFNTIFDEISSLYQNNPGKTFVIDYQAYYGLKNPDDQKTFGKNSYNKNNSYKPLNRFVGHGGAEINLAASAIKSILHDLNYFTAINLEDFIQVTGLFQKHLGMEGAGIAQFLEGGDASLGVTPYERHKIVLPAIKKGFLSIKNGNQLTAAWTNLTNSVEFARNAHTLLQGESPNLPMALNPTFYRNENSAAIGRTLDNLEAMIKNDTSEIVDPVTGEVVRVKLKSFYSSTYAHQDITALLPIFNQQVEDAKDDRQIRITNQSNQELVFRNYEKGRAKKWDNKAWSFYVPSALDDSQQPKSDDYMMTARRVLRFSYGGSLLTSPINLFVR